MQFAYKVKSSIQIFFALIANKPALSKESRLAKYLLKTPSVQLESFGAFNTSHNKGCEIAVLAVCNSSTVFAQDIGY